MSKQRETIERWQRSGLSKAEFARRANMSINTFHNWYRRYAEQPTTTAPAFIEVSDTTIDVGGSASPRLRFELPDGLIVTVY